MSSVFNSLALAGASGRSFSTSLYSNWQAYVSRIAPEGVAGLAALTSGPWRPPLWSMHPQLVSLTTYTPSQPDATVSTSASVNGEITPGSEASTTDPGVAASSVSYFFDAVMRIDHIEDMVVTSHPVQNGAAITDHVYAQPARVIVEAKFSDAQQSYVVDQYSGGTTKSVVAYQTFKNIKDLRLPCTFSTRLNQYNNMVIESMAAFESRDTVHSLHLIMRLRQIIMGTVSFATVSSSNAVSARPNQTNNTSEGIKSPTPTPQQLQYLQDVANPGQWNSNNQSILKVPSN